ncbi:MAG: hypothetical protein MJA84_03700 [Firmicutes bacterium]|nr:hypothetical protein [Bacillota bacterium]
MPEYAWIISAAIGWIIFLFVVDWSRLKYTAWGGLIVVVLQLLVDTTAYELKLYEIEALFIFLGSSIFFTLGVVLSISILFTQTLPDSRLLQGINIVVISLLFYLEEELFVQVGALQYIHWNSAASFGVNILVFTAFTWLVDALGLNRKGRKERGGFKL